MGTVSVAASSQSAGALFGDIKSAYYNVIRQVVVGSEEPEAVLFQFLDRLGLSLDVRRNIVAFIQQQGSLLATGNASPALRAFLQILNDETWFVVDRSENSVSFA